MTGLRKRLVKKTTWWQLDHHLWHQLKTHQLHEKKIIVALSGGIDSLALAQAFYKVLGPDSVAIAHFHHGGPSPYRQKAQDFCKQWAQEKGLDFLTAKWSGKSLPSEAAMRAERYRFLLKLVEEKKGQVVATAHHLEDVLETRLIRLLRGTGPQGLGAMKYYRAPLFRPFLNVSKKSLSLYLNKEKQEAVMDPSNQDLSYLRNWIRNCWLPQLEEKQPGAGQRLAQSLESMVLALGSLSLPMPVAEPVSRGQFLALVESEQKRWLAGQMLQMGQSDFTQFHLEEIRRRLTGAPKVHTFKVAGCQWHINAQQIRVQKA